MDIMSFVVENRRKSISRVNESFLKKLVGGVKEPPTEQTESKINEDFAEEHGLGEPEDPEKKLGDEPDEDLVDEPEIEEEPKDEEPLEITKEYIGNTRGGEEGEETNFYLIKTNDGDLQVVDQEGEKKFSAKEQNIDPEEVVEFILAAIKGAEIEYITRDVLDKYILPELEEDEEEEEELGDEEAPEGVERGEKPEDEEQELEGEEEIKDSKVNEGVIITIDTDNSAFEEDKGFEIARILRGLANDVEAGIGPNIEKVLMDVNGNRVGEVVFEKKSCPKCKKCGKKHWAFKPCGKGKKSKQIKDSKVNEDESKIDEVKLITDGSNNYKAKQVVEMLLEEVKKAYLDLPKLAQLAGKFWNKEYRVVDSLKGPVGTNESKSRLVLTTDAESPESWEPGEIAELMEAEIDGSFTDLPRLAELATAVFGKEYKVIDTSKKVKEGMGQDELYNEVMGKIRNLSLKDLKELFSENFPEVDALKMLERFGDLLREDDDALRQIAKELGVVIEECNNNCGGIRTNKLLEMEVNDGSHGFEVSLEDDGTLDTVILINGKEFRFDSDFAEFWRDEDGEMTEEGLRELALDALSTIEHEEYDELVVAGGGKVGEPSKEISQKDEKEMGREAETDEVEESKINLESKNGKLDPKAGVRNRGKAVFPAESSKDKKSHQSETKVNEKKGPKDFINPSRGERLLKNLFRL